MQKLLKAMHKNEKGFTLVELMVVVVIIGILVAIAIPIYATITERAEQGSAEANLRIIDGSVMMYYAEYSAYPTVGSIELLAPYIEGDSPADLSPGEYKLINNPSTHTDVPPRAGLWGEVGGTNIPEGDPLYLPITWE